MPGFVDSITLFTEVARRAATSREKGHSRKGLQELRWLYARRNLAEAQHDLAAWLSRWQRKYPKLTDWVEKNIGSTLTFYRLPRQHHKHQRERARRQPLSQHGRAVGGTQRFAQLDEHNRGSKRDKVPQ